MRPQVQGFQTNVPKFIRLRTQRESSEIRSRWVPDPTFLELSPVTSIFPTHDKQAWERGDLSTDALGAYIGDWSVVLVHF